MPKYYADVMLASPVRVEFESDAVLTEDTAFDVAYEKLENLHLSTIGETSAKLVGTPEEIVKSLAFDLDTQGIRTVIDAATGDEVATV